ncbi:hypothetical protein GGTG_09289 [Gaeumannomyces tritici R3-111a-1]|uniref:Uncharacterized protein n=1 Tax=Gaeumannomyces tritici (strain R3-111a-1) TaxID=644352 RepID=J3P6Z2_GAET3|nr:hypothetical protein GGTG_09289 [Gaeumannomyces tritici R3-111a-1]EJT72423.1 hypothetical protein GGTG_09289 [Gaeumannomyces tritici R3-111a-1]
MSFERLLSKRSFHSGVRRKCVKQAALKKQLKWTWIVSTNEILQRECSGHWACGLAQGGEDKRRDGKRRCNSTYPIVLNQVDS